MAAGLAFFIGDVTGHDTTTAAAVTSLARYTLRAVALRLDQQVSKLCTVAFGIADPTTWLTSSPPTRRGGYSYSC